MGIYDFHKVMNRNKFAEIILRIIDFDKKNERNQRLQTDKFALVSELWNKFVENNQMCYRPGTANIVDEQLFPTKAKCKYTITFGIKFWIRYKK
ncbi:piggyBac transposable element-derived protein 4-like [Vespula maculifrons]|uniref:PiggyBac transposable element-derived protein 4-like n=1 Tax=Vespula maculifrons TaxID=7453 RepID=A0ABD2ASZ2_VESMC